MLMIRYALNRDVHTQDMFPAVRKPFNKIMKKAIHPAVITIRILMSALESITVDDVSVQIQKHDKHIILQQFHADRASGIRGTFQYSCLASSGGLEQTIRTDQSFLHQFIDIFIDGRQALAQSRHDCLFGAFSVLIDEAINVPFILFSDFR